MPTPSTKLQRDHRVWLDEIDACVALAADEEACSARAPDVSGWGVAEQLEHLMRADRGILGRIDEVRTAGSGDAPAGRPKLIGRIILLTGFIPRGRGKAPDGTQPQGMSAAELHAGFGDVRAIVADLGDQLGDLESLTATSKHPLLGDFTARQWLRFCGVHHRHHRKIMTDILRSVQG